MSSMKRHYLLFQLYFSPNISNGIYNGFAADLQLALKSSNSGYFRLFIPTVMICIRIPIMINRLICKVYSTMNNKKVNSTTHFSMSSQSEQLILLYGV